MESGVDIKTHPDRLHHIFAAVGTEAAPVRGQAYDHMGDMIPGPGQGFQGFPDS